MFMYSLSLASPTAITQAIIGLFAGNKEQYILSASGSVLTLSRIDTSTAKVIPVLTHDTFGIVRQIAAARLAGGTKGTSAI
jgi:splicing factor 3B subunit 3